MRFFDAITRWLEALGTPRHREETPLAPHSLVAFASITFIDKPPGNHEVQGGKLYCVLAGDKPKWSLFLCPCGCRSVVTLSLQQVHWPRWRLSKTPGGRPTLYPSVWRDTGCLSHFWLRDGRVAWCCDTGTHPAAKPRG
jgi:hypothetical protein